MPTRHLLLLSTSRNAEGQFFGHAVEPVRALIDTGVREATFIPYAAVTVGPDDYTARVRDSFAQWGVRVTSTHEVPDPIKSVERADAIIIGGGNTFRLLERLQAMSLLAPVRARVNSGAPYLGWSAGSVVACPTIRTTNDMPIIRPTDFTALGLIPFQINAHYNDWHPPNFQGETRAERITELLALDPTVCVLGLREGSMVSVEGEEVTLLGVEGARLFRPGVAPIDLRPGSSLTFLLEQRR